MLRRARTLILVGMLCGCTGPQPGTPSGETTAVESTWAGTGFVYASATEVGVVRDGRIAARLPRKAGDSGVSLTRDGRFLYIVGTDAITVLDVRSLARRDVACNSECQVSLSPFAALGDSLVGGFDTGGLGGADGNTDVAEVKTLDLAAESGATAKTLGRAKLAFPHSAHLVGSGPVVQPYSYFLDAATGQYLFLDFGPDTSAGFRPWQQRQVLHLARLDGSLLDLGEYSFPSESAVGGEIGPDGRQFVVVDWNYQTAMHGSADHFGGPDYRRRGAATQALDLGAGRLAVIAPAPSKSIGLTTEYNLNAGSLVLIGAHGEKTPIVDAVTAIAELPSATGN